MLERLLALADKGAHICGLKPPQRAIGLAYGEGGDAKVRGLAAKLRAHKNFIQGTAEDAAKRLALQPRVRAETKMPEDWKFAWISRTEPSPAAVQPSTSDLRPPTWYFLTTANREETEIEVSFRETGRVPELWDAETATIEDAAIWRIENGRTYVTVPMSVSGSKFVVFRRAAQGAAHGRGKTPVKVLEERTLDGAWKVEFPHGFAPNGTDEAKGAPEKIDFPALADWKDHALEGVRYFSGTAVYRKIVELKPVKDGERVTLDLGAVKCVAQVAVNGMVFDPLWKPPFKLDITEAIAADGPTLLEIKVANLWVNRLIGDERTKEPDCEWVGTIPKGGTPELGVKEIPDWIKRGEKSPTGRFTFTTWKHWTKDDPLQSSGLLGPVKIRRTARRP